MSKLILGCLFFCSWSAFSGEDLTAVFRITNKQGTFHETHSIVIKDKKVFIDEVELPTVQVISEAEELIFLTKAKKNNAFKCVKGTYRFVVKKGNREDLEDGCAYSKRSDELLNTFLKVSKNIAITEEKK